jgi:hypothetical protein
MGFWMLLFVMVASYVISDLLAPKQKMEDAKPAGIGEFQFPTAEEGRVIPIVWGSVKIKAPNLIWYGDKHEEAIEEEYKVKSGLFSSKKKEVTVGYKYFIGMQFALCRGPIDKLTKVRVGEKQVFSGTINGEGGYYVNDENLWGGHEFGSGGMEGWLYVKPGSMSQSSHWYIERFQKQGGVTPRYLGICYLTWEGGYIGDSVSIRPWEFYVSRWPAQLSNSYKQISTDDANPIHVAYEIFTQHLGIPSASIDWSNWFTAASTVYTEGNGFSMLLDRPIEAIEVIQMIEDQIDGVFYLDPSTGKWKVNLVRGGYTLANEPQIDDSNLLAINEYTRGSWEDTINEIRVQYNKRNNEYQTTYAIAQDMANMKIQAGRLVSTTIQFPGVKKGSNANKLAWRELRTRSYPLAKATVEVTREFWNLVVGDVVSFSSTEHGVENMPMRVQRIDFGTLADGNIKLDLFEDVFSIADSSFDDPDDSQWEPSTQTMTAIATGEQLAFEAPFAFERRDPKGLGMNRVWTTGRRPNTGESGIEVRQRNSSGTPAGSFYEAGLIYQFVLIGELLADLPIKNHGYSFTIDTDGWDAATKLLKWLKTYNAETVGQDLANLLLIDDEFMAPLQPSQSGDDVYCGVVYRGLLDSNIAAHSAGAKVWVLCAGGGLLDVAFADPPRKVDVKLLTTSQYDTLSEGSATTMQVTMNDRSKRPYSPLKPKFNNGSTEYPTSVGFTSYYPTNNVDNYGFLVRILRRDFRIFDEILNATVDAGTTSPDFPTNNTTEHEMEVWNDPDGTPTLLFTTAWMNDGVSVPMVAYRNKIYRYTDGVIPSRMRIRVNARHTYDGTVYESLKYLEHDFDTSDSILASWFNLGARAVNVASNVWTVPDTGSYTFSLANYLQGTGTVEYRLNSGTWTTIIPDNTTMAAVLAGVTAGDTLEVRHTVASGTDEQYLAVLAPVSTADAYMILAY